MYVFRAVAIIKEYSLNLLFPLVCMQCGKEGTLLCNWCRETLAYIPPSCIVCKKLVLPLVRKRVAGRTCPACRKKSNIYAFLSPFSYGQPLIRTLIHELKYRRMRRIGSILGELLLEYTRYFGVDLPSDVILIPIPLAPSRGRIRGFNQAELIGKALADRLENKIVFAPRILVRTRNTKPQVGLGREARKQNIGQAFCVIQKDMIQKKTVLLLDDVKTTGVTLEEAARVLKEAGAREVWAITVAH